MHAGVDVGRWGLKVASGPTRADVQIIPSYVAPAREMDLVASEGGDLLSNLAVEINGTAWFVGELARRQGGSREYSKDKAGHSNTLPLILTGLALAAQDEATAPRIVVGLPIADYRRQAERFEEALVGAYHVVLPGGKSVTLELTRGQVVAFPEGAGAVWDMLLGANGKLADSALAQKQVGFLDIGRRTVNFGVMRALMYDDAASGTLPFGLAEAYKAFYKRLSREEDVTPARAEQRMAEEAAPELEALARQIRDELAVWWWGAELDVVYLAGGGGAMLADYLAIPRSQLVPEPVAANALGFYKIARARLK